MAYAIHVKSEGKDFYLADAAKTVVWGITLTPNINHAKTFTTEKSANAKLRQLNDWGWKKGISVITVPS